MSEKPEIPEITDRVSDAVENNWVDRFAPKFSRPFLRLSRADRPIGSWLLLLPCWWGLCLAIWSNDLEVTSQHLWFAIAFAIGAVLMRGAGCTWNDITDREIDAKVERTRSRPIPSGQVSVKAAVVWMALQAIVSFAVLLTFNLFSILLGIAALIPLLIYPFAKRFTWWPQVFLGIAFNWGCLLGWAVIEGSLSIAPFVLYLAGILWTLYYDTIYALQDVEDDAIIGVKSTARLFGQHTKRWLVGFLLASVMCLMIAVLLAASPTINPLSLVLALSGIWAFGWHMTWQLSRLDIEDPHTCLVMFRANRNTGLIFVLGLVSAIAVNHMIF